MTPKGWNFPQLSEENYMKEIRGGRSGVWLWALNLSRMDTNEPLDICVWSSCEKGLGWGLSACRVYLSPAWMKPRASMWTKDQAWAYHEEVRMKKSITQGAWEVLDGGCS